MPSYIVNPLASHEGRGPLSGAARTLADVFTPAGSFDDTLNAYRTRAYMDRSRAAAGAANAQAGLARQRTLNERQMYELSEAVRDLWEAGDREGAAVAMARAGLDVENLVRAGTFTMDPTDPTQVGRVAMGLETDYANTIPGIEDAQAHDLERERLGIDYAVEPVMTPQGTPGFARGGDLPGSDYAPILSESEQQGLTFSGLPQAQREAILMGQTDLTRTFGPDGRPVYTPEYLAAGETVAPAPSSTPRNYVAPDGSVYQTYDGRTDVRGNELPEGGYVGTVQAGTGDDLTATDKRAINFENLMANSNDILARMEDQGFEMGTLEYLAVVPKQSMPLELLSQSLGNFFFGDDLAAARQYMVASQQFLTAILRDQSGAAVPITEYPMYYAQFIAMPWDDPGTKELKRRARGVALNAVAAGLPPEEILARSISEFGLIGALGEDVAAELNIQPLGSGGALAGQGAPAPGAAPNAAGSRPRLEKNPMTGKWEIAR